jgi:hypothetical protein
MTTGDDLELHDLSMPGAVGRLLDAYEHAEALAEQLRAALDGHGISADAVVVEPGLCDTGEPVVRVVLAGVAAGRLSGLLVTGRDGGPPRRDVRTHPPSGAPGRAA